MSLRSKIVLILITVVVANATIDNGTTRLLAARFFGRLEREVAQEDLAHVRRRVDAEIEDLVGKARVLAGSSAMARFVAGQDPDFARTDLGSPALDRACADLLYVCDAAGKVLWGSVLDPDTREPIRLLEFPREALSPNHSAIRFARDAEQVAGVFVTKAGPLLLGTVPIPDPDGRLFEDASGAARTPVLGSLVLGRMLGPTLRQRIVEEELRLTAQADGSPVGGVELLDSGAPGVPPELARIESGRLDQVGDDGLLHAWERIGDLRTGDPVVLHVALDRPIDAYRRSSVNYVLLSTLIGGTLILFVLLRLLQHIVVHPLSTLTSKALEIGRRDDTTIRVGMQRADEIGQLAGEFDSMLEKLARSREQVVKTARMAGMSEIATGVLHNVGNVLNSVNVSANLATRRTEDLSLKDLEMLVGVLKTHEQDLGAFVGQDPRGKHLVPFLQELSAALASQRQGIQDELRSLGQGIEHIAELVRAQQSFAGTKGVFEKASLAEQLDSAIGICRQAIGNPRLEIEREFEPLPSVDVDKHKLMEILVNLIQNAAQALAESGREGPRITVRLRRLDELRVRIEVEDNGPGISAENLTRIFNHGFTTKKDGHGFGLHVSANAATEMGAKLHAHSDGPGRGAIFYLDIPMEAAARAAA